MVVIDNQEKMKAVVIIISSILLNLSLMGQTGEYFNLRDALANKEDVKSLYLNYNFIEINPITDSIGELSDLIEFRIQPRWFEFPKIENKKVVSEKIDDSKDKAPHRIPNGLVMCRNLRLLDISNTEVNELPEDLEQLENLEILILNYAPINIETEIPKISQLKNLKEIQLAGIEISESELTQLRQIENLKILAAYEDFPDIREESVDVQIHDTYIVFTNEEQADRFIRSMPFELGKRTKKYKKGNR